MATVAKIIQPLAIVTWRGPCPSFISLRSQSVGFSLSLFLSYPPPVPFSTSSSSSSPSPPGFFFFIFLVTKWRRTRETVGWGGGGREPERDSFLANFLLLLLLLHSYSRVNLLRVKFWKKGLESKLLGNVGICQQKLLLCTGAGWTGRHEGGCSSDP